MQTKELLKDREDIEIITFPHSINDWTDDQLNIAKTHNVFNDLQITAPVFLVNDIRIIGYLRIRKWLQDNK
jgi:hypothetical protein